MNNISHVIAIGFVLAVSINSASAGQDELDTATGAGFATALVERCTGIARPSDYEARLRTGMIRAGMSDREVREGFRSGVLRAQRKHGDKPPAKACKDALTLKKAIDEKFM